MEQETLYTAAKWDVLKALELSNKSPIELAKEANTSVSNISQSLRFLELAGIVTSERIGNRDKGQPRVMYSLSGNKAYMIITSKNFVDKKQIPLNEYKKILLRIWFYENESVHISLEKAIQNIEHRLNEIKGIFLDKQSTNHLRLAIVMNPSDKEKKEPLKDLTSHSKGVSQEVKYQLVNESEITNNEHKYYAIFDPQKIIRRIKTEE